MDSKIAVPIVLEKKLLHWFYWLQKKDYEFIFSLQIP